VLIITQDVADLDAVPLGPVVVRLGAIRRHRPPTLVADFEHRRRQRRHRPREEGAGEREHGEVEGGGRHWHAADRWSPTRSDHSVAECCSSSRESGDLIEMVLRRVSTDQCVGQGVYIDLDRRIGRERRRRKRRVWRGVRACEMLGVVGVVEKRRCFSWSR